MRYQETDGYVDNVYIDRDVAQRDDTLLDVFAHPLLIEVETRILIL